MKKRTWVVIGLLVVAGGGFAAYVMADHSVDVEMATIGRETLRETVTEEGRTRVVQRYVVTAPVGGQLLDVTARAGDAVTQGQLLARVFPPPQRPRDLMVAQAQVHVAEAQVNEALAGLSQAELQAEQAIRKAERSAQLLEANTISRVVVEQDEMAADAATRQVEVARAGVKAAEANLAAAVATVQASDPANAPDEALEVTSPIDGRVLQVIERDDRVVQAGTPIMELGDTRRLEVVVDVLSDDAVRIEPGSLVLIDQWGGPTVLEATVKLVEPDAFSEVSALGVSEQRVNVIAELASPPMQLGAGYRVEASIVTWQGDDVLAVPTTALFQVDGDWHVFAVRNGLAVDQTLTIGHRTPEMAEVLDGLTDAEQVVLFPSDLISDGTQVR